MPRAFCSWLKATTETRPMDLSLTTHHPDGHALGDGDNSATRSSFKPTCLPTHGPSPWRCCSLTDPLLCPLLLRILVPSKSRLPPQLTSNLPGGRPGSRRPACCCAVWRSWQSHGNFLSCTNRHTWGSFPCSAPWWHLQDHQTLQQQVWPRLAGCRASRLLAAEEGHSAPGIAPGALHTHRATARHCLARSRGLWRRQRRVPPRGPPQPSPRERSSGSTPAVNARGGRRSEPLSSGLARQSPYGSSGGFFPPL